MNGELDVAEVIQAFGSDDWRMALGGLELNWAAAGNGIDCRFRDRYCWKPAEPRASRQLHRAAENLKRNGARDFEMIGTPCVIPLEVFPKNPFKPGKKLLL